MSDILDRLRAYSTRWHPEDAVDLAAEAADEIERLRALVDQCDHHEHSLQEAHAEIERLTACLKWEQNWLGRVGTHAPGCWQWGPGHYLCAVRHIEGLEHAATEPANPADHAQG